MFVFFAKSQASRFEFSNGTKNVLGLIRSSEYVCTFVQISICDVSSQHSSGREALCVFCQTISALDVASHMRFVSLEPVYPAIPINLSRLAAREHCLPSSDVIASSGTTRS